MVKKLFDETALNILPYKNDFLIAYKKSTEKDEKMTVAYSMVSFKIGKIESVIRNVYQLAKYGKNYKSVSATLKSPFYWKTVTLPNGRLLAYFPDGKAIIFGTEGEILWNGEIMYNGTGPNEVAFNGKEMWASFGTKKAVAKLNLRTFECEIVIGGENSPFGEPSGLNFIDNLLEVCDAKLGKIWQINTDNYFVEEGPSFDEPIYQILNINDKTLVRLQSGVYLL